MSRHPSAMKATQVGPYSCPASNARYQKVAWQPIAGQGPSNLLLLPQALHAATHLPLSGAPHGRLCSTPAHPFLHHCNCPQGAGKGKRIMGGKPHEAGDGAGAAGGASGAAPSGRVPIPRSAVRLPLEVSTHLECKWRDGKFYPARIIERRRVDEGAEDEYEYYVHYRKCECGAGCAWAGGRRSWCNIAA